MIAGRASTNYINNKIEDAKRNMGFVSQELASLATKNCSQAATISRYKKEADNIIANS